MSPEIPSEKGSAETTADPHPTEDPDREFSPQLQPLFSALSQLAAEFQREEERRMAPIRAMIDEWMRLARAAHEIHPQLVMRLVERGWYHSYYFTDTLILTLHQLFEDGRTVEVDALLAEFTRSQMDRIETELVQHFASRAAIIRDAFGAHRSGQFTLSVPTLLAQADGVGREVLQTGRKGTFNQTDRTESLAARLRVFELPGGASLCDKDSIYGRMLSPLLHKWSLSLSTEEHVGPLNRHGVLHGLHTDYGSEQNSFRCILLLGFLLDARKILDEDLESRRTMIARLTDQS